MSAGVSRKVQLEIAFYEAGKALERYEMLQLLDAPQELEEAYIDLQTKFARVEYLCGRLKLYE